MLGAWLVSVDLLEIDTNEVTGLGFTNGKVLGASLEASEGPTIGSYDDTELLSLEVFIDRSAYGIFDGLFLGDRLGLLD